MEENSDLKLKIQNLEEQLKKHESPIRKASAVSLENAEIAELTRRNHELRVKVSEEREAKNRLKAECDSLRLRNQNLVSACIKKSSESAEVNDDPQQIPSSERLQEICDRILASLKLGKQAAGYKIAAKALDMFMAQILNA